MAKSILVVGAGSVGKRHLRNLAALGCKVSAMDPRADRLAEAGAEVPLELAAASLEAALQQGAFDGVVICSPPRFHVAQSRAALDRGIPVLLEKPVSIEADEAAALAEHTNTSGVPVLVGYTYRWWPALQELRKRIHAGAVGKVLHTRCVLSAHLADWHPWERYQDFFMASRELGGGALLDESHFVDLLYWLYGSPRSLFASVDRISDLEIDTDDNVDALFSYHDGSRALIHLDLFGRPHERSITVTGDHGTIIWTFDPNALRFSDQADGNWEVTSFQGERNDMFVAVAREFLDVIAGKAVPSCTAQDGLSVMRLLAAMRESAASQAAVSFV